MNKIVISLIFVSCICLCSCKNINKNANAISNSSNTTVQDTVYNENIQNVFFDTPFGASQEEVIKNFEKHGFLPIKLTSTDVLIHFNYIRGQNYSFGNMSWDMLDVGFNNGKFNSIYFINSSKDKATAFHNYESILSHVSAKYKMIEQIPQDTTIYKMSIGLSKGNRFVFVFCSRYETIQEKIKIGTVLQYYDRNYDNEVSDEL